MRTTASGWVRSLWQLAESKGLDAAALFQQAGLNASQLDNPLFRYPQDQISQLWDGLVAATGDPGIGLEFGRQVTPATFGAVGYAMLASANLKEGIQQTMRFQRYLGEALRCDLEAVPQGYRLQLESVGDRDGLRIQTVEAMLSAFIHYARWVLQRPLVPLQLSLRHQSALPLQRYTDVFGCPVQMGTDWTGFVLDAATLEAPQPNRDPSLLDHHLRLAEEWSQRSFKPLTDKVKALLSQRIPGGGAQLQQVAQLLHLSSKTLQRKLDEEGSSFSALLDEARFGLACEYLLQPQVSLTEVAELAGYADYSAFAKAFRKWAGQTPRAWREQQVGSDR